MSKFQFSWQQVVVLVAILGAVSYFALSGNGDKLESVGMGVLALLALVARSPIGTGSTPAPTVTFPDEEPTKKEGRSIPPLPVIFMLLMLVAGCAAAAESSYTAQQLQCVDRARTLEESKACRAEVDRAWHVDAGK